MKVPLRTRYLQTLGLAGNDATTKPRLEAALTRAYALRNFEIEHYWKRGTYFWAFQVAIFAALGLILAKAERGDWQIISLALAGLGFLTAVANAFSAGGSRFWQENWEKHIDMLEDEFEGRLYKTVWLRRDGSVSFSVSRVNQYLSNYFILFWVIIYLDIMRHTILLGIIIAVITLVGLVYLYGQTTRLNGTFPGDDGSHGRPMKWDWQWPVPIRSISRLLPRLRRHIRGAEAAHPFIRRRAPGE